MIRAAVFCASLSIDEDTLEVWTASGWLDPRRVSGEPLFSDFDQARGRFIFALQLPNNPPRDRGMLVNALDPEFFGGAKSGEGSIVVGIDGFDR